MSIASIKAEVSKWPSGKSAAYCEKQIHSIPEGPVVDRERFILDRVRGKSVLEFGASGPMSLAIRKVASSYLGVDRSDGDGVVGYNLDDCAPGGHVYPWALRHPEVIVCGEVIEHLSNPGYFLEAVSGFCRGVPVIITVPNAFSEANQQWLRRGQENVNRDHVAWYSPRTLKTLLERAGYRISYLAWYKGQPVTAEGIIVIAESA